MEITGNSMEFLRLTALAASYRQLRIFFASERGKSRFVAIVRSIRSCEALRDFRTSHRVLFDVFKDIYSCNNHINQYIATHISFLH
jgi:hypothetical protein